MKDLAKFKKMMAMVCDEKYNKTPSPVFTEIIWTELKLYTDDECAKAFKHVFLLNGFYKDLVYDLLAFLNRNTYAIEESAALLQASMLISHMQAHGAHKLPDLSDPITRRLMTKRWIYATWADEQTNKSLPWWKKDFVAEYVAYKKAGDYPTQIQGPEKIMDLAEKATKPLTTPVSKISNYRDFEARKAAKEAKEGRGELSDCQEAA